MAGIIAGVLAGLAYPIRLKRRPEKQKRREYPDMDINVKNTRLEVDYREWMDRFFCDIPNAVMWGGASPDDINVTFKGRRGYYTAAGYVILSEDGEIKEWRSKNGRISLKKEIIRISEEMLISQIRGLLTDDERASKYCEQVSLSLLEDGSCVFNAPYGLQLKDREYEERYCSREWEQAWIGALMAEFQTKEVCRDEKAGVGCFRLQAI